ncbi:MAG: gamma-glutamylcyclotransferase family protein [Burkholderiaceae bacterium]
MPHHIFTYGSLMFPQVWQRVVRGHYHSVNATVYGYARYAIAGETYPAMIDQADASVTGVVYFDVDDEDVAVLDAFEGNDYRRECVPARIGTNEVRAVETYIYLDTSRISNAVWEPETFQLQRFLDTYCPTPPPKE